MKRTKATEGLIRVGVYRAWSIKWPYGSDRYIWFGPRDGAERAAKRLTGEWPYKPTIREIKL